MKRFLTAALALAATASLSQAAVIVSTTRTNVSANWDKIDFRITALTGADGTTDNGVLPDGSGDSTHTMQTFPSVGALNGTFSIVGSGVISATGTTSGAFKSNFTNANGQDGTGTTPRSFVDFDTISSITKNVAANNQTPTSITVQAAVLAGPEYRLAPAVHAVGVNDGSFDNTLLAEIFVTKGADVQYSGTIGTYAGTAQYTITTLVPEPASLSLLGLGVLGLAARRRQA